LVSVEDDILAVVLVPLVKATDVSSRSADERMDAAESGTINTASTS
jgi:hypothetical protein